MELQSTLSDSFITVFDRYKSLKNPPSSDRGDSCSSLITSAPFIADDRPSSHDDLLGSKSEINRKRKYGGEGSRLS